MKTNWIFICVALSVIQWCSAHHHHLHGVQDDAGAGKDAVTEIPKDVKRGISKLSFNLLKSLTDTEPEKNKILSPISIFSALSLALLGSDGKTKQELLKVLGLENHEEHFSEVHQNIGSILKQVESVSNISVNLASALFLQNGLPVEDSYKQNVLNYYGSETSIVDFKNAAQTATDAINNWVSTKTKGKIPKLYDAPLSASIQALLASSIYFSGTFEKTFNPNLTRQADFNTGSKTVKVDMMMDIHTDTMFVEDTEYQYEGIVLPYTGSEAGLLIVVPTGTQTLKNLTTHLTARSLMQSVKSLRKIYVQYSIPKLKLGYSKSLKEALGSLGVVTAFSDEANFKNLSPSLKVDDVKHKTILEVTEYGTVAAGVTTVSMVPLTYPRDFQANKPFLFFVYHMKLHVMLFNGAIYDPTQSE